jgi:hypothetical protein
VSRRDRHLRTKSSSSALLTGLSTKSAARESSPLVRRMNVRRVSSAGSSAPNQPYPSPASTHMRTEHAPARHEDDGELDAALVRPALPAGDLRRELGVAPPLIRLARPQCLRIGRVERAPRYRRRRELG